MMCRSNPTAQDLVTVSFLGTLPAGQSVVIHTQYKGSLLSGLARSEAFDYIHPATQQSESQVRHRFYVKPCTSSVQLYLLCLTAVIIHSKDHSLHADQ